LLSITDKEGKVVRDALIKGIAGFNGFNWDLVLEGSQSQRAGPGEYKVELIIGKLKLEGRLVVKKYVK